MDVLLKEKLEISQDDTEKRSDCDKKSNGNNNKVLVIDSGEEANNKTTSKDEDT